MFLKPKNSKQRLQALALYVLNYLSKNLFIDGQQVAALRTQNTTDTVATLERLGRILAEQRIDTLKDFDITNERNMEENHGF